MEYRVEHPPWRIWHAARTTLDCDIEKLYGPEFVPILRSEPHSAFLAEGSPVAVHRGVRIA